MSTYEHSYRPEPQFPYMAYVRRRQKIGTRPVAHDKIDRMWFRNEPQAIELLREWTGNNWYYSFATAQQYEEQEMKFPKQGQRTSRAVITETLIRKTLPFSDLCSGEMFKTTGGTGLFMKVVTPGTHEETAVDMSSGGFYVFDKDEKILRVRTRITVEGYFDE